MHDALRLDVLRMECASIHVVYAGTCTEAVRIRKMRFCMMSHNQNYNA